VGGYAPVLSGKLANSDVSGSRPAFTMDRCQGSIPVSTKVDRPMREFVEDEAERLGVNTSEFLRRLLLVYRRSRAGEAACEHCGESVNIPLGYS
jgi:hypothetical protein